MMQYYISIRKISGDQFIDAIDLGSTRYLKIPDGEFPLPKHAIPITQWIKEVIDFFPIIDQKPNGELVFFVHGYNNTVQNIIDRQRSLSTGLNMDEYSCLVVSFDWPSDKVTLAYLDDLDHAQMTAIRLVNDGIKLFVKALRTDCDIRVHVLGHSMGAFVIREAFDHADGGSTAEKSWTANQLVLFAGDASAAKFSASNTETTSLFRHCYRMTNYFNGFDSVLQISNIKRLGFAPRVGRAGLPGDAPEKAVNVDCSRYYNRKYGALTADVAKGHSWYFDDSVFLKDLRLTLQGAIDRNKMPTREVGEGRTQILLG